MTESFPIPYYWRALNIIFLVRDTEELLMLKKNKK